MKVSSHKYLFLYLILLGNNTLKQKPDAKGPTIIRVQNIGMDDKRAFEIFSKDYYEFLSQAFNS